MAAAMATTSPPNEMALPAAAPVASGRPGEVVALPAEPDEAAPEEAADEGPTRVVLMVAVELPPGTMGTIGVGAGATGVAGGVGPAEAGGAGDAGGAGTTGGDTGGADAEGAAGGADGPGTTVGECSAGGVAGGAAGGA